MKEKCKNCSIQKIFKGIKTGKKCEKCGSWKIKMMKKGLTHTNKKIVKY